MKLIVLIVGIMLFFVALVVALAVLATLAAAFVRAFRNPLERWLEWVEGSFYDGGRR